METLYIVYKNVYGECMAKLSTRNSQIAIAKHQNTEAKSATFYRSSIKKIYPQLHTCLNSRRHFRKLNEESKNSITNDHKTEMKANVWRTCLSPLTAQLCLCAHRSHQTHTHANRNKPYTYLCSEFCHVNFDFQSMYARLFG